MGLPARSSCLFVIPLLLFSGAPLSLNAARPRQSPATFRSRTDLVALDVSVEGQSGEPVPPLDASGFVVLEDNVPQDITFFAPEGRLPLAVVLLVDHSQSMAGERLARAKAATSAFLRMLEPDDRVEILAFDEEVTRLYPLGGDHAEAERSIRDLSAGRSTALYDALLVGLRDLERDARSGAGDCQHAIVVLSDGDDTSSLVEYDEVLDLAKRSETAIYAIGLRPQSIGRRDFREAEFVLRQLSQETGGRVFFPTNVSELTAIYQQISDELVSQYTLAYASKNPLRNGAWRRVIVRLKRPGVVARTRQGYYGPSGR